MFPIRLILTARDQKTPLSPDLYQNHIDFYLLEKLNILGIDSSIRYFNFIQQLAAQALFTFPFQSAPRTQQCQPTLGLYIVRE